MVEVGVKAALAFFFFRFLLRAMPSCSVDAVAAVGVAAVGVAAVGVAAVGVAAPVGFAEINASVATIASNEARLGLIID